MIIANYTRLFSIEVLHDFYTDRREILQDISIKPDDATLRYMNGYRLKCKVNQNKLLCFVQTRASIDTSGGVLKFNVINKPLVTFDEGTTLDFLVSINAQRFLDRSNLRRYFSDRKILHFGNDSGNKLDALLSLSAKIPPWKTSEIYKTGMLTANSTDQTFEAIRESDPSHPQNTTKILYWSHVTDHVQYVNQADLEDDSAERRCFAVISVSFKKNLPAKFSLLKKSSVAAEDNTILNKEYLVHFKINEVN
jgi:hypothetical protein